MAGEILIRIDKNGEVHLDVEGVNDASCEQLTQAFEKELGTVEDVQHKPEFYVELDDIHQEIYEDEE